MLLILVTLVGCATPQQKQQQYWSEAEAKLDKVNDAWKREYEASPDFQILKPKLPGQVKNATFAQLSDESKLNLVEKEAWGRLQAINDKYGHQVEMLYAQYTPWLLSEYQTSEAVSKETRLELYQGKISVGQYLKLRQEQILAGQKAIKEVNAQHEALMRSNAAQQAQIDQARSAAALNAMGVIKAMQPAPVSLPTYRPPLNTNCTTFGSQTNCITQ